LQKSGLNTKMGLLHEQKWSSARVDELRAENAALGERVEKLEAALEKVQQHQANAGVSLLKLWTMAKLRKTGKCERK